MERRPNYFETRLEIPFLLFSTKALFIIHAPSHLSIGIHFANLSLYTSKLKHMNMNVHAHAAAIVIRDHEEYVHLILHPPKWYLWHILYKQGHLITALSPLIQTAN